MLVNWEKVAERRLARAGWLREVAGEADWGRVVAAFARGMEASPPRGALLSGAFGCGKTLAATALYRVEGVDGTPDANAYAGIVLDCAEAEEWPPLAPGSAHNHRLGWTVLDDMGAEPEPDSARRDIVGARVMQLHRRWSAGNGCSVAVTTNLTGEQMAARYGGRVMSRLMEMVVPVALAGRDKRRRVTV